MGRRSRGGVQGRPAMNKGLVIHARTHATPSGVCVCVSVYGRLAQIPCGTHVHACPAMIITVGRMPSECGSARRGVRAHSDVSGFFLC